MPSMDYFGIKLQLGLVNLEHLVDPVVRTDTDNICRLYSAELVDNCLQDLVHLYILVPH